MPITFHGTLHTFTSTVPNTTEESLDHPYIARVELTHGTPLSVRECWEEVVQELAVVGIVSLGPECEEVIDPLSPTTRFLHHLEEDFLCIFPFQLYHRLRQGPPIPTQPNPNHCPCPHIGQPRALTHPCHTSLSSPQGERSQ